MKKIKLPQGKYALVDDEDFKRLNQWKWSLSNNGYAVNSRRRVYMHRLLNKTPAGMDTDHINRNKLDNRKPNLRTLNRSRNIANTGPRRTNKLGVKGVHWNARQNKYQIQLSLNGSRVFSRYFSSLSEAKRARKEAEINYGV